MALMAMSSCLVFSSCGQKGAKGENSASVENDSLESDGLAKKSVDFSYKDIAGNDVSLKRFTSEGKYVVLDFWGTWCPWCIKGIPEMKSYYDKYKSKMEIIGVNSGDDLESLLKAAESNNMNWTHIMNHEGESDDLVAAYSVEGYPTKIIISPEGDVVGCFVGETQEFYDKLDELLN